MRLLLDSHIFLWAVSGSRRLKPAARRAMESADAVFVSAASLWEVAIKVRLGKIDVDPANLCAAIEESGFVELPVRASHTTILGQLPLHHRDPFDRMLVAQAISEPLRLLTADAALAAYSDLVLLV